MPQATKTAKHPLTPRCTVALWSLQYCNSERLGVDLEKHVACGLARDHLDPSAQPPFHHATNSLALAGSIVFGNQ
jgi:hypothetical protein